MILLIVLFFARFLYIAGYVILALLERKHTAHFVAYLLVAISTVVLVFAGGH